MTREQAKELLPIIQAYAEGEIIQYKNFLDEWTDIKENEGLSFICPPSDYRIKPQPKYRPFKSQEECWSEMLKHQPFGWLRDEDGDYILPATVGNKSDFIFRFKVYKFADGTPFGIKEEIRLYIPS